MPPMSPKVLSAGPCPLSWKRVLHFALVHRMLVSLSPCWPRVSSFQTILLLMPQGLKMANPITLLTSLNCSVLCLAQPPLQLSTRHPYLEPLGCWLVVASTLLKLCLCLEQPPYLLPPSSWLALIYPSTLLATVCGPSRLFSGCPTKCLPPAWCSCCFMFTDLPDRLSTLGL